MLARSIPSDRLLALMLACLAFAMPAVAQGTGLIFLDPDRYRSIPLAPPAGLVGIPAEMDLSKDFPTPGDQGNQGSCVGWAVGYALKSYQERRERLWTNWDDTRRMSPAFVYNQIKVGACGDGARIADALDLVTTTGAAAWIDQPYSESSCNDLPTTLAKQNASVNRVAAWFRVNPQDRQAIRTSIAAGIPVVVGMTVDDRFKTLRAGEVWRGGGVPGEAHAMVVVGYSDDRDAVKVINSWGTDWGDGGFGWIDFETFRSVTREAYVAQDIVLPVGTVERNRATVSTTPTGPTFFGVQLGMSEGQVRMNLSRDITREYEEQYQGNRYKVFVFRAPEIGLESSIWIQNRTNVVTRMDFESFEVDVTRPEIQSALGQHPASQRLKACDFVFAGRATPAALLEKANVMRLLESLTSQLEVDGTQIWLSNQLISSESCYNHRGWLADMSMMGYFTSHWDFSQDTYDVVITLTHTADLNYGSQDELPQNWRWSETFSFAVLVESRDKDRMIFE